jgi:hypothetical protein
MMHPAHLSCPGPVTRECYIPLATHGGGGGHCALRGVAPHATVRGRSSGRDSTTSTNNECNPLNKLLIFIDMHSRMYCLFKHGAYRRKRFKHAGAVGQFAHRDCG